MNHHRWNNFFKEIPVERNREKIENSVKCQPTASRFDIMCAKKLFIFTFSNGSLQSNLFNCFLRFVLLREADRWVNEWVSETSSSEDRFNLSSWKFISAVYCSSLNFLFLGFCVKFSWMKHSNLMTSSIRFKRYKLLRDFLAKQN